MIEPRCQVISLLTTTTVTLEFKSSTTSNVPILLKETNTSKFSSAQLIFQTMSKSRFKIMKNKI